MRWRVIVGLLWVCGCTSPTEQRARINDGAGETELLDTLTVTVAGGSVVSSTPSADGAPHRVRIRAQSLDLRIEVSAAGCDPEPVVLEVSHLGDPAGLEITRRSFLNGVSSLVAAARAAAGGAIAFTGDANDPERTPLEPESAFSVEAQNGLLVWTLVVDRGRNRVQSRPGDSDTQVDETVGACAALDPVNAGPLANAALVVRTRLRRTLPDAGFSFAVWGNNRDHPDVRARLLDSLAQEDLAFAVITGDLVQDGNTTSLREAAAQLDAGLNIPWFATVGDRDVAGSASADYVDVLGQSSFAFDAGAVRLLVLDSADATLDETVYTALPDWLADKPLWWPQSTPPVGRIVLTHVPPLDPYGARRGGFKHRPDAARLIGQLIRADVRALISGHLAIFESDQIRSLDLVHSGGGGQPMEGDSTVGHHWLRVTVGPDCRALDDPSCPAEGCPDCIQIDPVPIP